MAVNVRVYPLVFIFESEEASESFIRDNNLEGNRRLDFERTEKGEVTVTAKTDIDLLLFYHRVKDNITGMVGRDRYTLAW